MRQIVYALIALTAMAACTSIDCPVQNLVYTNYAMMKANGTADTLDTDTLWILTRRANGTDTALVNGLTGNGVTSFILQISHNQPEDVFFLDYHCYGDGGTYKDTFRIKKEDIPHFESVDCQAAYFHVINSVTTTHHVLDSIVIKYPKVNYDVTRTHYYIYFKADR